MGAFDDLIPRGDAGQAAAPSGPRGIGQPEELTFGERLLSGVTLPDWMENLRGSTVYRAAKGMANPVVGAVQTVANLAPDSDMARSVNRRIAEVTRETDAQTKARGNEVMGAVGEFAGEVLSPVNALIAAKVPLAATAGARALQGAGIGAGTAAMQPVTDAEAGGFWGEKSKQVAGGALAGAVLTPALGRIADAAVRKLARPNAAVVEATGAADVDGAIAKALDEAGQRIDDLPADVLAGLRREVTDLALRGKKLDAAAALRKADFDALGIEPTLGQITRDPTLYAKEKNLQSIAGVGDELTRRFAGQNAEIAARVGEPARGARDAFEAGSALSRSLKSTDDLLSRHVSGLYREARSAAPGAGEVPLQGLAQDAADILRRYEGANGLAGIRNILEDYGVVGDGLRQTKVFGFDEAEALLKRINKMGGDPTSAAAAGELRTAVKRAITEAGGGAGPYDVARKAAAERFKLMDAVPALRAAAEGSVAPDDFVRRFVIAGKTEEVKGLAGLLKSTDPAAWQEARAQIADELRRAGFGANPAGDGAFSPRGYMDAIRRIGPNKLEAFFTPQEVADMMRVGRVGAYMRSHPADAPVNTSRSAGVGAWMLSKFPGGTAAAALGNAAARTVNGSAQARRSLEAAVPIADAELTPGQMNLLARLLGIGAVTGGVAAGSAAGR